MVAIRYLKRIVVLIGFGVPLCSHAQQVPVKIQFERNISFDHDWKFERSKAAGAEESSFPDSGWRTVNLPHDWSIEDLPGNNSPFDPKAVSKGSTGFMVGGTGWYRKKFTTRDEDKNKVLLLQFDGIYMQAEIFVNGRNVYSHKYGYTSFSVDISKFVSFGKENVIAVKVINEGNNSRWYSGSGIYRHVWLSILNPVHIPAYGITVSTKSIDKKQAEIAITIQVEQPKPTKLLLINTVTRKGEIIARNQIPVGPLEKKMYSFTSKLTIPEPLLWSPDSPSLYTLISEVYEDGKLIDQVRTPFGIRSIQFTSVSGFSINGQNIKLKGGCVHHDNGPLGAMAFDRAEFRRVSILKDNGYNAIRCAHNPPSPAFLDACDSLGMLVIDEIFDMWTKGKNPDDYHLYFDQDWKEDLTSMIKRDRNHPSIILWSIGNEIPDMDDPSTVLTASTLAQHVKALDSTRNVTAGVNSVNEKKDPFFSTLDIAGYNYAPEKYEADHKRHPARIMYGSESSPLFAFQYWMGVKDYPWVVGDFVWTAFDYLGEASIGWRGFPAIDDYPWHAAYCGDIDICGWKRPQSYYRDVLWSEEPTISLFVKSPQPSFPHNPKKETWSNWNWLDHLQDWNWQTLNENVMEVTIYSNCPEVKLMLNGKTIAEGTCGRENEFKKTFTVKYVPGVLTAQGVIKGKKVCSRELITAGPPSKIILEPELQSIRPTGQELVYVVVNVTDKKRVLNPKADNLLKFSVKGPAEIIAVGNANPVSTESFQSDERKAWRGKCLVVLRDTNKPGIIELTASSDGLESSTVQIESKQ